MMLEENPLVSLTFCSAATGRIHAGLLNIDVSSEEKKGLEKDDIVEDGMDMYTNELVDNL